MTVSKMSYGMSGVRYMVVWYEDLCGMRYMGLHKVIENTWCC